jgi:hypothetical protein
MSLALTGSLTVVQFCNPAELPLILNKLKRFENGSLFKFFIKTRWLVVYFRIRPHRVSFW